MASSIFISANKYLLLITQPFYEFHVKEEVIIKYLFFHRYFPKT